MTFTPKRFGASFVVLLGAASVISCATHSIARDPSVSSEQRITEVDAKLATLRPILRGHPPRVSSEDQRREVEREWKDTETELQEISKRSEPTPEIEWRLGELYRFGHNLDVPGAGKQCVSHLERAIALRPDYAEAYLELGVFYTDAGLRWAPLGEANLKKAIEASKPTPLPRAWRALTFAYYYQGKFADSAAAADQYLLLVPDDDDVQQMKKVAQQAASRGATGFAPVGRLEVP